MPVSEIAVEESTGYTPPTAADPQRIARLAGLFEDDPFWDAVMQALAEERELEDEQFRAGG